MTLRASQQHEPGSRGAAAIARLLFTVTCFLVFLTIVREVAAQQGGVSFGNAVVSASAAPQLLPFPFPPPTQPEILPPFVAPPAVDRPQKLHVFVGRSLLLTSPSPLKRLSIADPLTADALLISSTQILVNGKAAGNASLIMWNEAEESRSFEVEVDLDVATLEQRVHDLFPQDLVQLSASNDVVAISGHVSSKETADKIVQLVTAINPKVVNLLEYVSKPQQGEILLEVKFAEVDRTALSQFGFNLLSLPGSTTKTLAVVGTGQFGSAAVAPLQSGSAPENQTQLTLSELLNIFIFRPDINLGATIQALQQQNLAQILAEPNILTETGKEATFLSGGEFPFPVVQGGAAGTPATVTIQFKEFGVRLTFTPELTEDGMIHLRVRPEVSALDFTNAVTLSGFVIPAISTRRVEAQLQLRDGQSFAIAGLVDDRVTNIVNKVPILGDVPWLGQLFRSHSYDKSKDELLILVTPRIVQPIPAGTQLPGLNFPEPFLPPDKTEKGAKPPPNQ